MIKWIKGWFSKEETATDPLEYTPHAAQYDEKHLAKLMGQDPQRVRVDAVASTERVQPDAEKGDQDALALRVHARKRTRNIDRPKRTPKVYNADDVAARELARKRDRACMNASRK